MQADKSYIRLVSFADAFSISSDKTRLALMTLLMLAFDAARYFSIAVVQAADL